MKWNEAPAAGDWRSAPAVQVVEPSQNLAQAAAAGGSRGVLGLLDIIPQGLAGLSNTLLGTEFDPRPSRAVQALLPLDVGTYQPQTPGEEKAAFAGEVLGSSLIPGTAAVRMASAPARALRTEIAATTGAITGGIAGETFGGEQGRAVGTIAGGLSPIAAPYAARRFVSPYGSETFAERVAASQRQDVPITAGEAAGGSFLEKASAILPGGQRQAQTFQGQRSERMGERVQELVNQRLTRPAQPRYAEYQQAGGPSGTGMQYDEWVQQNPGDMPRRIASEATSERAGRAIRQGIDDWRTDFRARQGELYREVDELIAPETLTPMTNTRRALEEMTTPEQYEEWARILDPSLLRRFQTAIDSADEVPYELLTRIRSSIGEKLDSPELLAGISSGSMRRLYGALSRDMEDVAAAVGPEAERAATRANTFTRAGHRRVDDFLDPIRKKNLPEEAYKAVMAGSKEGASRLRAMKRTLNPEQWDIVAAATLRRLARVRPSERTTGTISEAAEDFSPETFLTNLENIDPAARRTLFAGSRFENLESNLDDLMTLSQGVREQRQAAFNPSGTAGALGNVSWLSALPFINPMQTARLTGGVLGNMYMQRALQSPAMLDYLANPTAITPSGLGQVTRAETVINP